MLKIIPKWFARYKFFNSLFLGLSVGAIFTIYTPLEPSIYSLGGIILAIFTIVIARFYDDILNTRWFFRVSLLVELILLIAMVYFLLEPYTYQTALLVYLGYQATFVFGSYLVRAETLLLSDKTILTKLDTLKQLGYLVGLAGSYAFYKIMSHVDIIDKETQVYNLHYILIAIEVAIIILIFKSFTKESIRPEDY